MEGVKLQLEGQREDAVWQAELDAFAALIDQFNAARMQIGNVVALFDATQRERRHLASIGFGTREEAFAGLTACVKEVVSRENALRLRTAPAYADAATAVRERLMEVMEPARAWCVAREERARGTASLRQELDARMDTYRAALDSLVEDSQGRFSRPRLER